MKLESFLVLLFGTFLLGSSLFIYVPSNSEKCISQELDNEDVAWFTVGMELNLERPNNRVDYRIYHPSNSVLFSTGTAPIVPGGGNLVHKYNADTRGSHVICFSTGDNEGSVKAYFDVRFQSRTVKGGAIPTSLRKSNNATVEAQLQVAEEAVGDLIREIEYARRQEVAMRSAEESTSDRIQYFGFLSIFVLLTISCWQVIYLRHFFKTKKIL